MATAPQIPQIPTTQSAPDSSGYDQISGLLDQTSKAANTPLPQPYIVQPQLAQPKMPQQVQFNRIPTNNQPVNNQSGEIQRARTKNNIASIFNLVGAAGKAIQNKKIETLKTDLKEVMTAKQNIANAQQVLQQDPNNAAAKQVLDSNKKSLEAILTDPKKQKQLTKALDLSFTDPDKNKTPEVQAYQQAQKEVKEAGAFTSDNPAEHAVAQAAANGGKAPVTQQQAPQQAQPQAPPKSQTPYADAAIAKDMPGLAANPQYAAALKQRQDAQKQINQYVIPNLIKATQAKQIEAMRQDGDNARANLKATIDYINKVQDNLTKLQIADTAAKARIQAQAMRDKTAITQTSMRVKAALEVAKDNRLSKENQEGIKRDAKGQIVNSQKANLDEMKALETQRLSIQADPSLSPEQKKEKTNQVEILQQNNLAKIKAYNHIADDNGLQTKEESSTFLDNVNKMFLTPSQNMQAIKTVFGADSYKAPAGEDKEDVGDKSTSDDESKQYDQFVGADNSDEPGVSGDEESNSDNY